METVLALTEHQGRDDVLSLNTFGPGAKPGCDCPPVVYSETTAYSTNSLYIYFFFHAF